MVVDRGERAAIVADTAYAPLSAPPVDRPVTVAFSNDPLDVPGVQITLIEPFDRMLSPGEPNDLRRAIAAGRADWKPLDPKAWTAGSLP
jgi:hypothetical protein